MKTAQKVYGFSGGFGMAVYWFVPGKWGFQTFACASMEGEAVTAEHEWAA